MFLLTPASEPPRLSVSSASQIYLDPHKRQIRPYKMPGHARTLGAGGGSFHTINSIVSVVTWLAMRDKQR